MPDNELTRGANNDIMREPRQSSNKPEKLAMEGSRQELLRGGRSRRRPFITYEPVTSADGETRVNKAFDILFEEVMSIRKSNNT
jgi:hypothetical protein